MISFPALFFAISSVALIAALAAIWSSLRVAFGGGPGVVIETARDLPDHAALVEEKNSLLRAIKDLEYEHAVGKISDADHQRLDAAYRARAKQVLAQLDRDVKPLYERAERLIADHVASGGAAAPAGKKKKRREEPAKAPEPAASEPVAAAPSRAEALVEMIRSGEVSEMPELPSDLDDAERAKVVATLQQMLQKLEKPARPRADAEPAAAEPAAAEPAAAEPAASEEERSE